MELVRLTRPVDALLFLAAALLGGWLAAGADAFADGEFVSLAAAALAATLVGLAGNVINDVYDIEIDRANAPLRPLPSGALSVATARTLWGALSVIGCAIAFASSLLHGTIAVAAVALVWAYSAKLKRVPMIGHAVVGLVVAMGIVFGALAVDPQSDALPVVSAAVVLTFVLVTAREIVKAIPDIDGDRAHGVATLPVSVGRRRSAALVVCFLVLSLAALPAFPAFGYDPLFIAYAVPLGGLLIAAAWILLVATGPRTGPAFWSVSAGRASRYMKAALAVGTVALALGRAG